MIGALMFKSSTQEDANSNEPIVSFKAPNGLASFKVN